MSADISSESKSGLEELSQDRIVPKIRIRLKPPSEDHISQLTSSSFDNSEKTTELVTTQSLSLHDNKSNEDDCTNNPNTLLPSISTTNNDSKDSSISTLPKSSSPSLTNISNSPSLSSLSIITNLSSKSQILPSQNPPTCSKSFNINLRKRPNRKSLNSSSSNPVIITNNNKSTSVPIKVEAIKTNRRKNNKTNLNKNSKYKSTVPVISSALKSLSSVNASIFKDTNCNDTGSNEKYNIPPIEKSSKKSFNKYRYDYIKNINLKDIVNYENFLKLPIEVQFQLIKFLPNCDKSLLFTQSSKYDSINHINTRSTIDSSISLHDSSLVTSQSSLLLLADIPNPVPPKPVSVFNNEFITKALTNYPSKMGVQCNDLLNLFTSERENLRSRPANILTEDKIYNDLRDQKCDSSNSTTDTIEMTSIDKDEQDLDDNTNNNSNNKSNETIINDDMDKVNSSDNLSNIPTIPCNIEKDKSEPTIVMSETNSQYTNENNRVKVEKSVMLSEEVKHEEMKVEVIDDEELKHITDPLPHSPMEEKPSMKQEKVSSPSSVALTNQSQLQYLSVETNCSTPNSDELQNKKRRGRKRRSDLSLTSTFTSTSTTTAITSTFTPTNTCIKSATTHTPVVPIKRSARSTAGKRPSRLDDSETPPHSPVSSSNSEFKKSSTRKLSNQNKKSLIKSASKQKLAPINSVNTTAITTCNIINDIIKDLGGSKKYLSEKSSKSCDNNNNTSNKHQYHKNKQKNRVCSSSPESLVSQGDSSDFSNLSKASPNSVSCISNSNNSINNTGGILSSLYKSGLLIPSNGTCTNISIDKKSGPVNQFQTSSPSWSCTSESTTPSGKSDYSNSSVNRHNQHISSSYTPATITSTTSTSLAYSDTQPSITSSLPSITGSTSPILAEPQSKPPHGTPCVSTSSSITPVTIDGMPPPRQTLTLAAMREKMRAKKMAKSTTLDACNAATTSLLAYTPPKQPSHSTSNPAEQSSKDEDVTTPSVLLPDCFTSSSSLDNPNVSNDSSVTTTQMTASTATISTSKTSNNDDDFPLINSSDEFDELLKSAPDSLFELLLDMNKSEGYGFDSPSIDQYDSLDYNVESKDPTAVSNDKALLSSPASPQIPSQSSSISTNPSISILSSKIKPKTSDNINHSMAASNSLDELLSGDILLKLKESGGISTTDKASSPSTDNPNTNNNTSKLSKKSIKSHITETINILTSSDTNTVTTTTVSSSNPNTDSKLSDSSTSPFIIGSNQHKFSINSPCSSTTSSVCGLSSNNTSVDNTNATPSTTRSSNAYLVDSKGLTTALSIIQSLNPGAKVTTQHFYLVNSGPQLVLQPSSPVTSSCTNNNNNNNNNNTVVISSKSSSLSPIITGAASTASSPTVTSSITSSTPTCKLLSPVPSDSVNSFMNPATSIVKIPLSRSTSTNSNNLVNPIITPISSQPHFITQQTPQQINIVQSLPSLFSSPIRLISTAAPAIQQRNLVTTQNTPTIQQQPKLLFICPTPQQTPQTQHTQQQQQHEPQKYVLLTKQPTLTTARTQSDKTLPLITSTQPTAQFINTISNATTSNSIRFIAAPQNYISPTPTNNNNTTTTNSNIRFQNYHQLISSSSSTQAALNSSPNNILVMQPQLITNASISAKNKKKIEDKLKDRKLGDSEQSSKNIKKQNDNYVKEISKIPSNEIKKEVDSALESNSNDNNNNSNSSSSEDVTKKKEPLDQSNEMGIDEGLTKHPISNSNNNNNNDNNNSINATGDDNNHNIPEKIIKLM